MAIDPKRVKEIFLEAADLSDEAARAAYLDKACAGDAGLRERVEALLRSHDPAGSFLGTPAAVVPDLKSDGTMAVDAADPDGGSSSPDAGDASDTLQFLTPPGRPDSLGRLGHYEVLQVLGKGGFGIVLRAFDEVLQRVVAIKVLSAQLAATSPARKRFLREARSSAMVRHENVVQVYAVEEQPLPYLVMEFIPGGTLQQRIDRTGPLETPEVLQIGRQIAEGLAAAHAQGLIHRDIKPGNILLEAGPNQHVKITDFGLARAADDASVTQSGTIAGTPMFMAPEQALGGTLDHRADLFSLGSVLYTMASGRPPFRANSTLAVLKRVAEDTPRPIPEIIPEVPPWLCDLIARLHAKKPADRIATAREVADLIARGTAALQRAAKSPSPPAGAPVAVVEAPREDRAPTVAVALPKPAPGARTGGLTPRRSPGMWAAAALLALLGGLGFTEVTGVTHVRGTVIRLFSPEGTLEIQVDDPAVSVQIDGSDLVITGAGAREIRLKPGSYMVKGIKDGQVVSRELVTVQRGEKVVLKAWFEPVAVTPPPVEEADRRAAEYVLYLGGTVKVNAQDQEIKAAVDLPRESFRLTTVFLFDKPVTDAKLVVFKDCKNLTELTLVGAGMLSDAGLACFKSCRNLTCLNLNRTAVTAEALAHFGECKNLTILNLSATKTTDAALAHFKDCKNLTILDLSYTPLVTDAGLAHFKDCTELTILSLRLTQVGDVGVGHFKNCTKLTNLNLEGTRVGDVGVAHFKSCKDLTSLQLFGTQVSDAGLANFKDCKNLVNLELSSTRVGDVGLAHFKDCKNLYALGLLSTQVSDAGLAHFKDCQQLTWVHLSNTQVSDTGLVHFKDCKNLQGLVVKMSKVTATGIDELKKTLPKCQIEWDGGVIPPK